MEDPIIPYSFPVSTKILDGLEEKPRMPSGCNPWPKDAGQSLSVNLLYLTNRAGAQHTVGDLISA